MLSCLAAEEKSGDQQHGAGGCTGDSDETPPDGRRRGTLLRFRDPFRETAVGRFGVEEGVGQVSLAPCVVGVEVAAAVFLRRAEPVEEFGLLGIGETFAVEVACDQSVDMSVLCVHLSYSRIGGPNPYLPDRKDSDPSETGSRTCRNFPPYREDVARVESIRGRTDSLFLPSSVSSGRRTRITGSK